MLRLAALLLATGLLAACAGPAVRPPAQSPPERPAVDPPAASRTDTATPVAPSPAAAPKALPTLRFRLLRDQVYSPPDWPRRLMADVYLPEGAGPFPAVLLVHGGGWSTADRRKSMQGYAQRLAERGYVAVSAAYRVLPEFGYPAPLDDLQQALRALRQHAAAYRVDPRRIGVLGYSAGGHLAALLGVRPVSNETRVQAVVAGGAPTDLRLFPDEPPVRDFLGGSLAQRPGLYAEASPISHVQAGLPPVFLFHGEDDQLVPPAQSQAYCRALLNQGVPCELRLLPGRDHYTAFDPDPPTRAAILDFLDRALR